MENNDFDVEIVTPDVAFWKGVVDARKIDIEASEKNLRYFKAILEMAEKKLAEAEEEMKSLS